MSSQATLIRDAAFDLLKTIQGYKTLRRVQVPQLQPDDLPALTVIRGDEVAQFDGDASVGPPHFVNDVDIHVSVVRGFGDPLVLDGAVDREIDAIEDRLLSDPDFNRMFEGVTVVRRTSGVPQQGETYFFEMRLSVTVQFRTIYNPTIRDDFKDVDVTVGSDDQIFARFTIPEDDCNA